VGKISRRGFLGISAATAAAAAFGKLPSALRAARAVAPAGGSIFAIKHVVILMQENRSFDHYFGTLRGVRGFDDPTALRMRNGNSVFNQPDPGGSTATITPFHLNGTANAPCIADLDHSWNGTHTAWNCAEYDAWVAAKGAATMGYFNRTDIPFHYALADGFTICDNYFCSVMGPTKPNRLYLWSGTIDPAAVAGGPAIDNNATGFSWTTYPERLQAAGVSWKVYQNANDNFDDNALAWFKQYQIARPGTPLYERGMASVPAVTGATGGDIVAAIESDALNGTLPLVSWIVAPEQCSEHPSGTPAKGADFIARVLAALTADPDVWASTVLLINYDENDGFFDHVPPPVPAPGTPDEFIDGVAIGLGPRVPMFVISPWSRGGYVCSEVFDHTSVIRFLEVLTGVVEPNISPWRRQLCGDLTSAFDFTAAVTSLPALPVTRALAAQTPIGCLHALVLALAPESEAAVQESGNRPARALPYQPNATCRIDHDTRAVCIEMTNSGVQAAHHAIYANSGGDDSLRQYDVPAHGGSIKDRFSVPTDGRYDLSVYGPNGFLRRAAGNVDGAGGQLEVTSSYGLDAAGRAIFLLTITNGSNEDVVFAIESNANRSDGPQTDVLTPGQTRDISWDVELYTNGYYDFTAMVNTDPVFLRRFAGRLEPGARSFI
jgi:phospholipase C